MNSPALRTAILWIHVLAGAGWVAACAAVLLVAGASGIDQPEGSATLRRTLPIVNRIGFASIATLLLTGIANLFIAAAERHNRFSRQFIGVLAAKGVIFIALFLLLSAAMRVESHRRLLIINGSVAALGATALGLGLWLMGS